MRQLKRREYEILCPVGNADIFKELIKSKADAFYLGGKKLNMRMHRKNFNFTDEELIKAIDMAHASDKKIYITMNNLIVESELKEAKEFLIFLSEIKPDAIIFQDLAILDLAKTYAKNIDLHASVMTNVASFDDVKMMEEMGVKRIIVSREVPLKVIEKWSKKSDIEFEYFVYGDMCVCHGSRCYYSGILLNQSSNRGRCMKPCRWQYSARLNGEEYSGYYPLAVKDMYMYEHFPEMIKSGVMSFKIEGRMRSAEYIKAVVDTYADSLDRYIENPENYNPKIGQDSLYENRMRDFSTSFAFGDLGEENFNERFEGTGYFYSTGKVFSNPTSEIEIDNKKIINAKKELKVKHAKINKPKLAVKVDNLGAAKTAFDSGADIVYLSANAFNKESIRIDDIIKICDVKKDSKIILCTPLAYFDDVLDKFLKKISRPEILEIIDGFLVATLGALKRLKGLNKNLYGDYTLNVFNSNAFKRYSDMGIKKSCLSVELNRKEFFDFLGNINNGAEIIVHGSPTVMQFESDIFKNLKNKKKAKADKGFADDMDTLILVDDIGGEHPVKKDEWSRGHMLMNKDICLMPILDRLIDLGIDMIRIEAQHFSNDKLKQVILNYKQALKNPKECQKIFKRMKNEKGFTLGALNY